MWVAKFFKWSVSHLNLFHVPVSSPCTKYLSSNMVEVHKRCPVVPIQSCLLSNSLHFTGALEKRTLNEWKKFLSYTAGWCSASIPRPWVLWLCYGRESSSPLGYRYQASGQALAQGVSSILGVSTSHLRLARRTPLFGKDSVPWLCAKPWWCNSLLALSPFVIISDFCIGNFQNSCLVRKMLQNLNDNWNHGILEIEERMKHCEISLYPWQV